MIYRSDIGARVGNSDCSCTVGIDIGVGIDITCSASRNEDVSCGCQVGIVSDIDSRKIGLSSDHRICSRAADGASGGKGDFVVALDIIQGSQSQWLESRFGRDGQSSVCSDIHDGI